MSTLIKPAIPESDASAESLRKPLSTVTMLFYGAGQTGGQIFRDAPAALLPVFMATMLGVSPWLAGIVVLIPKLWLIICDPLMGIISDRMKPLHSRRPFMVIGGISTSVLFIGLFAFSGFASQWWAALCVGVIFFAASTAFSAFSVPYLAVASELSADPHERTKLLAFRMIFMVLGVILGFGLAQPLVFALGGDAAAWLKMALLFGLIGMISMLITAYGVPRDFGANNSANQSLSLLAQFRHARENKPFAILTAAYFIQSIAQASGYAVVGFVFIYAVGDINLLLPFILVMASGSISSQPLWLKLSRRIGKVASFWGACLLWMAVTITWLWVGNGQDVLLSLPFLGELSTDHSMVLLRAFIIGITNSGFSLLSFSLLTDTINRQKQQRGYADEGLFSGIFSAVEKLAFALGPLLAGVVMSYTGFEASVGGAVEQTDGAIQGMVMSYSVVPTVMMFFSLLVFTQYKKSLQANT
ncbi:MAG: MFS transporter [Cellvibrionaceae bacterium]|nr:MFS transporter [Cellvibrionaceae bacterium]